MQRAVVPEGVLAPVLTVINDTAVRLSWQPPLKPNGPISAYMLYINDVIIDPRTAWPTTYVIGGLLPYTVYDIQVSFLNNVYFTYSVYSERFHCTHNVDRPH